MTRSAFDGGGHVRAEEGRDHSGGRAPAEETRNDPGNGSTAEAVGGAADLALDDLQRDLLLEEARALHDRLPDAEARERYAALIGAVEGSSIPSSLVGALQDLLELGLETGRFRRRYTAEGEGALLRLYWRTPRGAALREEVEEVSRALEALRGRELREAALTVRGPGAYSLTLAAGAGRLTLRVGRDGARVESVEVDA